MRLGPSAEQNTCNEKVVLKFQFHIRTLLFFFRTLYQALVAQTYVSMRVSKFVIGLLLFALFGVNGYAQSVDDRGTTEGAFSETVLVELKNQIDVYPNPAVEFLMVEIKDSNLSNVEFEMHSIIGNTIRIEPEEVAKDTYKISVKNFNTGYYFLIVKDEYTRYKKAIKFLKN